MNLVSHIFKQYRLKQERNWNTVYWLIDLHDTVIPGTYTKNNENREFYPFAKEALQILSDRTDTVLILWTSSHDKPAYDMMAWMREHGILFRYLNTNPLETNTELCDFTKKVYFNILLDDKAGFEGDKDWEDVWSAADRLPKI